MIRVFITIACVFALVSGCITPVEQEPTYLPTPVEANVTPEETEELPTHDPTFAQPNVERTASIISDPPNSYTEVPTTTPTNAATVAPTRSCTYRADDPIIGEWSLQNGPYPCEVKILPNGVGAFTCGVFPVVQNGYLQWMPSSDSRYDFTMSTGDNTKTADALYTRGIITSGILPSNSYLVKNG